jgi:hypothetical protein
MTMLDTIATLSEARPLDQRTVEDALSVALRGDPTNTNRYIARYKSFRAAPGIAAVELRVPLTGATRKDGMLIVDLDAKSPQAAVTAADVRARFGDACEVVAPQPEQPAGSPHYLSYAMPWGALRFGFATPSWDVLSTFVIDVER